MSASGFQTWQCFRCGAKGLGTGDNHPATHPAWSSWAAARLRRLGCWVLDMSRWFDGVTR